MQRVATIALILALGGCGPTYVWGDKERIERELLAMVPVGSSPARLQRTANERGWRIDPRNIRRGDAGAETSMHDTRVDCRSRGGLVVPVIIDQRPAPLDTTVESLWLFDQRQRLQSVCVRKTVDAF